LRLELAGIPPTHIQPFDTIESMLISLQNSDKKQVVPLFATYTAMIEIQRILEKLSVKKQYWEE
jgi:hypothetical protein